MNDVLPGAAALWERFEDAARRVLALYGYRNLRVPVVEPTALYVRGIGEHTDVVEREMYTFEDRLNGESLTLRPEATAGIVRAAIEHHLTYERGQRVWTTGPMFRHERPQKGRYRQFHQVDVEALGFEGPDVDAEQIVLLARLWRELGLADGVRLADQLDRRQARSARASPRACRVLREARVAPRRGLEATAAHESPAHPRQQEPGAAADDRGRAAAGRHGRGRGARALRGRQAPARRRRHRLRGESAARARPRLLQSHRVRVDDRPPRRAGHGRRRRALRRPVRAARRQARFRLRLRDRRRADDPAARGRRDDRGRRAARLRDPRREGRGRRARRRADRVRRRRAPARRRPRRGASTRAAAASSRR